MSLSKKISSVASSECQALCYNTSHSPSNLHREWGLMHFYSSVKKMFLSLYKMNEYKNCQKVGKVILGQNPDTSNPT